MAKTQTARQLGVELVEDVSQLVVDQKEDTRTQVVRGDYPYDWYAVDFFSSFGPMKQAKVRVVASDLECAQVDVITFDPNGWEIGRATFRNMAAGLVVPVVVAYLA